MIVIITITQNEKENDTMKKLTTMLLAMATLMLMGCGSAERNSNNSGIVVEPIPQKSSTDTEAILAELSAVQEELKAMKASMDSSFEELKEASTASSQVSVSTVTSETVSEQQSETPQVLAIYNSDHHCFNLKLYSDKATSINNPTDLQYSGYGKVRDLALILYGDIDKVNWISWIRGENKSEDSKGIGVDAFDYISYAYFNMEKGEGIYTFEFVTPNGTFYSSVLY